MTSQSMALSVGEGGRAEVQAGWSGSRDGAVAYSDVGGDGVRSVRRFDRCIARSPAMHELFDSLERLAQTDLNLVLFGETGDLLGSAIHERSGRRNGPYVMLGCHSLGAGLESELPRGCGLQRGLSSDGAVWEALSRARGGTLFLDRVDRLPRDLQSSLRGALDERRIRRADGSVDPIDVRVIAATNLDLSAEVTAGRFRKDLFYRLAGALTRVPSQRPRKSDVVALRTRVANDLASDIESCALGGRSLWLLERAAIRQTLMEARGDKALAARTLAIPLSTLYAKVQKHGL